MYLYSSAFENPTGTNQASKGRIVKALTGSKFNFSDILAQQSHHLRIRHICVCIICILCPTLRFKASVRQTAAQCAGWSKSQYGTVRHSMAQYGTVRHSMPKYGKVRQSTAQYGTVQKVEAVIRAKTSLWPTSQSSPSSSGFLDDHLTHIWFDIWHDDDLIKKLILPKFRWKCFYDAIGNMFNHQICKLEWTKS